MYSIKDVLKKSFLQGFSASDISIKTVVVAMALTALIGIYIFLLYRFITRKTFYSKNFNVSLVCVALITTAIIITIQSSIVVSLGMVGALSIVRFRTAVKDPLDLTFLFWSISTGIMCGAGFAEYALALSCFLTVVIIVLNYFPILRAPLILVVNSSSAENEENIIKAVKENSSAFCVKSRNMSSSTLDMTIEVRTKNETALIKAVNELAGVESTTLLAHNGETTF